jgi:hypothetical protein
MEKFDDIKKLGPREKLVKLKEIEKKNKEEIEQARKMMEESEREVEIEDELKEIPIPEIKAVNIDELFSAEAKEIFKTRRFTRESKPFEEEEENKQERRLEETVAEEAKQVTTGAKHMQYNTALDEARGMAEKLAGAYDTIKDLVDRRRNEEYMTNSEQERLDSYSEMARNLYQEKFAPGDDEQRQKMMAAERLLYDSRVKNA